MDSRSSGDQVNTDPLLGPLAANGGPTLTHAELPGSPAIDHANSAACPATDQRDVSRPQPRGGACDIGAFELVRSAPITAPTGPPVFATPPPVAAAVTPPATVSLAAQLALRCSNRHLTLTDVLARGNHVLLDGAADAGLVGKQIDILFNDRSRVATAVVGTDGLFKTTAPLPPRRIRNSNSARYLARAGSQRSLDLKLTRRLILQPPTSRNGGVSWSAPWSAPGEADRSDPRSATRLLHAGGHRRARSPPSQRTVPTEPQVSGGPAGGGVSPAHPGAQGREQSQALRDIQPSSGRRPALTPQVSTRRGGAAGGGATGG